MFKLLRADFYKLFRSVSFYICAALTAIFGAIAVFQKAISLQAFYEQTFGIELDMGMLGLTGLDVMNSPLGSPPVILLILTGIAVALFTVTDFSNGTIKNIISRGHRRVTYFFSKLVTNIVTSTIYTVISCAVAFGVGNWVFSYGEPTKDDYVKAITSIGTFMILMVCIVAMVTMLAFVCRNSGGAIVAAILVSSDILSALLFSFIDWLIKNWELAKDFRIEKYWPAFQSSIVVQGTWGEEMVNVALIVCGCWFVFSLIVGIFTFMKRDIK